MAEDITPCTRKRFPLIVPLWINQCSYTHVFSVLGCQNVLYTLEGISNINGNGSILFCSMNIHIDAHTVFDEFLYVYSVFSVIYYYYISSTIEQL